MNQASNLRRCLSDVLVLNQTTARPYSSGNLAQQRPEAALTARLKPRATLFHEGYTVPSATSSLSIQSQRERLKKDGHRINRDDVSTALITGDKLLYAVEKHGVIIGVGQTGCGKTTQLPQYLMESGWAAHGNIIACTQPRRVATTSVAGRVASEVGSILGDEVGYTIRFEDVSDKSIRRKRPSLRLIVSSATLDATSFLDYFTASTSPKEATIVSLEGRMYPVKVAYLQEPAPDYVRKAAEVAWNINLQQGAGDILVFLTGREDIERCLEEFSDLLPTLLAAKCCWPFTQVSQLTNNYGY
ncbi:P-loop containing nucleoside triphosphate hydrolase protein [Mycena polygramma]|nr:P-loop containing nucleoside triphosphate hydrolase protein [Mycena polygramma]